MKIAQNGYQEKKKIKIRGSVNVSGIPPLLLPESFFMNTTAVHLLLHSCCILKLEISSCRISLKKEKWNEICLVIGGGKGLTRPASDINWPNPLLTHFLLLSKHKWTRQEKIDSRIYSFIKTWMNGTPSEQDMKQAQQANSGVLRFTVIHFLPFFLPSFPSSFLLSSQPFFASLLPPSLPPFFPRPCDMHGYCIGLLHL